MIQILELFGGIGSPRCALRNIGIPVKAIDYVEIDEKAVRSYNAMFADELPYKTQSVVGWNLKPDILIHGSPCQDFSIAGHQGKAKAEDGRINRGKGADKGSGTRSSLMWETIHIIEQMGEWKPQYVIWENVKNVLSKYMRVNFNRYLAEMERLGYSNNFEILDARDFGLPQARERVFTVSVLGKEKFIFDDLIKTPMQDINKLLLQDAPPVYDVTQPSVLEAIGQKGIRRATVIEDYAFTITARQDRTPAQVIDIGNYFKMLNGYSPTFTSFSGGVYEMDLTRTAINNFATHCSKLKPEIEGSALKSLEKTLQHKPNYFMDTTKFIKRLATYVAVEHTAFIIPIEDEYGRLCGWYPLRAERCEVVESERQLYLRYLFANGSYGAIEFERVGIMTDFEYKDDLFGEDNSTLAPTMQLIHTQNEGIINAVKNSANIRFLAKVANILKPEDIKKERKRFTEDNLSADNDSGMIIYDNKFSELKQVESKPYTPNALQMQHIQENVCTHFGTNMDILQNKFDENTWNAYYEGKIEPFAIQLSLVMTNMSFTERERACGNAIFFSANRLQYASNATKLSVSTQLFDRALLNRNGVMDIWNMAHVEDGEKYYIRKEYTEVSELHKGSEQPVIIQQVPQQTEPAAGEEPQNGQEEKEGVNNAS